MPEQDLGDMAGPSRNVPKPTPMSPNVATDVSRRNTTSAYPIASPPSASEQSSCKARCQVPAWQVRNHVICNHMARDSQLYPCAALLIMRVVSCTYRSLACRRVIMVIYFISLTYSKHLYYSKYTEAIGITARGH